MAEVILKPGHVRPVWAGHPWVFAQGIAKVVGQVAAGDEVSVSDPQGNVLGRGLISPESAIGVRLYSRDAEQPLDAAFVSRRMQRALARRRTLGFPSPETNAYRVINAEGDGLPGLIVDQLGDTTAVQFLTLGMKRRQHAILRALEEHLPSAVVVDRTPARTAKMEGFDSQAGIIAGDPARTSMRFREHGLNFELPLQLGQKTGYYLDLRALRRKLARLSAGRRVLDCYCYVGAAGLNMAQGGAEQVLSVDSSEPAVNAGQHCVSLNELGSTMRLQRADAQRTLAQAAKQGGYDLVLCDPPKLMPHKSQYRKAQAALERLASAALRATRPGGRVVLCSCSAGLGLPELTRALAVGGRFAGRQVTVLERVYQDSDHPVPAAFPEGLYQTSVIAEVELDG